GVAERGVRFRTALSAGRGADRVSSPRTGGCRLWPVDAGGVDEICADAATDDKTSAVRPRGSQSLYARIRMGAPRVPRSDTLSAAANLLAEKLQKSTLSCQPPLGRFFVPIGRIPQQIPDVQTFPLVHLGKRRQASFFEQRAQRIR